YSTFSWAVGNNGVIIATTNGGLNWVSQTSPVSVNLNSVEFSGTGIWIAGNAGNILKTTNSGVNWIALSSGTSQDLKSIKTYGGNIWAAGNNGTVIRSTNSGINWNTVTGYSNILPAISLNSIAANGGEDCWVVSNGGSIYRRRIDSLYFNYFKFTPNNIHTWLIGSGVFNQDISVSNQPGFNWPAGSLKYAIFTSGLSIGGYVNNSIRLAVASYLGEYKSGYVLNNVFATDNRFKIYRVKRGETYLTNPDWNSWGLMVPFGAPFTDINNNGSYEPQVDIPGIKDAKETIFMCITDADPASHRNTGFSGGTAPLYAEVHLTAWGYDNPAYNDIQFFRWVIINKGSSAWDSTNISIVSDPDLGNQTDDYIGSDSTRNLGYCYNADNDDGSLPYQYGINPPAVGMMFLNCASYNAVLSSFDYFTCYGCAGPPCEKDPNTPSEAYNFMNGTKKDRTPWVIPSSNPPQTTKFCYSGDPESNSGWTEYSGKVENCGGLLTGNLIIPVPPMDRRMIINYKPSNNRLNPGDTAFVQAAQLIARGSSNKNSVTLLKQLADVAKNLCQNGFVIGINPISTQIPEKFNLYQNYPNPFNPVTKIKFDIPRSENVIVKIYDALGRETAVLVNEKLKAGSYSVEWDGINYP